MRTQRRVFEKLSETTKVELASEKIELGLIDDVKKAIQKIKDNNKNIINEVKLTQKAEQNYEKLHTNLREDLVDVFDKGLKAMDDAFLYVEKQEKNIQEIKKISKELGVDVPAIKEFEKEKNILNKITDDLDENLAVLKDIFAD